MSQPPAFARADPSCASAAGLAKWKETYYREKLELKAGEPPPLDRLRLSYCEGLAWVLQYYYRGVCSWGWYYPFHYAPTASDLVGPGLIDAASKIGFTLGAPFAPFEQLLAVLPSGALAATTLPLPCGALSASRCVQHRRHSCRSRTGGSCLILPGEGHVACD